MKKITEDVTEANPESFKDIFESYKDSVEINETPQQPDKVSTEKPFWLGDKRYYQTGKKAGQLRPIRIKSTEQPDIDLSGNVIITGSLIITFADLLIPVLISALNNRFSKTKINADSLRMDTKQRQSLEPVADAVAKQLAFEGNPIIVFFVGLIGIYGMNYLALKATETK